MAASRSIDLPTVLVLAGGLSHERDVSLRSGRRVAEALRGTGASVRELDVDAGLLPAVQDASGAVVVPLLHGATGEDGALRDVLDLLGVPYVGTGPDGCRLAVDKPTARTLLAAAGADVPAGVALTHATFRELGASAVLDAVVARLGLPLVVKPARGGSALGMTVVRTVEELPAAMVGCFAYGEAALLERHVRGVEVAVSVVESRGGREDARPAPLPPVEIVPDGGVYDYAARYTAGSTEFFVPARLDAPAARAAQDLAVLAHRTLGLRDWSRTDLVIDDAGRAQFLEVNVAPGMTETSLLPMALEAAGLDVGRTVLALVRAAAERGPAGTSSSSPGG